MHIAFMAFQAKGIIAAVKTSGNLDTEILLYPPGGPYEAYTPFSEYALSPMRYHRGIYDIGQD